MRKIIIDNEIFQIASEFQRGIIVVKDIENNPYNENIEKLLKEEILKKSSENSLENELIKKWEEIHLKFGSNPNKFPPSIKSLIKRVQSGGSLPFINPVVALFNYISIKYLLPCGGDDVEKIEGNLHLGISNGTENFTPLGTTENESPKEGEVIYFDDISKNVMCRRWNWRNGDFTKITEHSKKLVINIDGVSEQTRDLVNEATNELAQLLIKYCKSDLAIYRIDINNKTVDIEI